MIDLSHLFTKTYDRNHYHCGHFVRDVWLEVTGNDIADQVNCFLQPEPGLSLNHLKEQFKLVRQPVSPCIVLCKNMAGENHAGVYYAGCVYHIEHHGPTGLPLNAALIGYRNVRFYQCLT